MDSLRISSVNPFKSAVKIPNSIWTLLIGIIMTLVCLWYGQNHGLLPTAASNEADLVDGLFNAMITVSLGVFVLVEGILIYTAFRYKRQSGDNGDGPAIEGNVPLEILWTIIPTVIVIGISVYSFEVYNEIGGFDVHGGHQMPMAQKFLQGKGTAIAATLSDPMASDDAKAKVSPEKPGELIINATGLQYAWIFAYPDSEVTSGELHVPIGREVRINLTANDVIHAFWVPEFRLKQDAIPGRETTLRFTPKVPGDYSVICAELCGPYHGVMKAPVIVESPANFDRWIQEQLTASKETLNQAVAVNPANLSPDEFLAPYTEKMGIQSAILHQVHM
jgi:cytochrome c oxidase subunit 2